MDEYRVKIENNEPMELGAEEMIHLVNFLPWKHEDLS